MNRRTLVSLWIVIVLVVAVVLFMGVLAAMLTTPQWEWHIKPVLLFMWLPLMMLVQSARAWNRPRVRR